MSRWDAENRLIQINYPSTGNNSAFTYDGFGQCAKIVETTGGGITSTKQFIRSGSSLREARDASGTLTAQYFLLGQTSSGANYSYQLNQRGDVTGVTDSSGNQVASIAYDPYGRPTFLSGSFTPDFGFTGLYLHQRSGLNIAVYRAYSSRLGRWINRDPIEETGGVNLYAYVANDPSLARDPSGLEQPPRLDEGFWDIWALGFDAGKGYDLAKRATKEATDSKIPIWPQGDDPRDAYRHCLFSCLLTSTFGPEKAKIVGDQHEHGGHNPANLMDLANNAAGRAAAGGIGGANGGKDCECKCRALLGSGGLVGPGGKEPLTWPLTPGYQAPKIQ